MDKKCLTVLIYHDRISLTGYINVNVIVHVYQKLHNRFDSTIPTKKGEKN